MQMHSLVSGYSICLILMPPVYVHAYTSIKHTARQAHELTPKDTQFIELDPSITIHKAIAHSMPWFPAVPPALAAADGGARISKKRAGLPRLLHKLFIKVLRLRPASAAAAAEECCYYYSYGGAGSASWAGVLSSIPEEGYDDSSEEEGTPDVVVVPGPAVLRKAKSERYLAGSPGAATVVQVEVLV